MTQFYNRYRGLFDSSQSYRSKQAFQKQKERFLEPKLQYSLKPIYSPSLLGQAKTTDHHIGRSPALDEFERNVLPKLKVKYPEDVYRIKTEMQDNTNKMQYSLIKNNSRDIEFYQLPKIYGPQAQSVSRKERVLTEGSVPLKTRTKFKDHNNKNITKSIEELEKEYFRYYPRGEDKIANNLVPPQPHLFNSRKKIVTENKQESRLNQDINSPKQWQAKALIQNQNRQKKKEVLLSPPKLQSNQEQYKAYQSRQNQLYGIKQNPYAFVNSKVEQIKKSQKYIPRGFINSYREALLKRRQLKNKIEERRDRLRTFLYQQERKYGLI